MIPLLLALAAAQAEPAAAAPPLSDEEAYRTCAALTKSDATRAVAVANDWLVKGGGILARQCAGLAYVQLGQWERAAAAFGEAAQAAEGEVDPRRSDFWVQSGNAWLAAGDAQKARQAQIGRAHV